MRLVRHGRSGAEKPGLLDAEGRIRDLSGHIDDITPALLADDGGLSRLAGLDPASLPRVEGEPRLGAPIAGVPNLVCIGLNYADHARETNSPIPEAPIVFMKHTGSIIGPNDQVRIPRGASKADWEVELGVVIGKRASYVDEARAMEHVVGYCIVNDVSERDYQFHGGANQWIKGKSPDTFAPIGPWLVTKDEIPDPQNLAMWLEVDGHRYQDGSTRTMIFDVAHLVSHLSRYMTLLPGDIISTGTPPGVGAGVKPNPVFLKPGNVMRLGIEGLGEQRQEVGQA
ncbi:MAG TPA: fumarylacetoacetate hydrolase family protein [Geminicoccaceae bacterium]|nr:fumarylacetoacetate hydrolase family protein [Geminicoccaceae bacterium]